MCAKSHRGIFASFRASESSATVSVDVVCLRSANAVSAADVTVHWDISRNLAISTKSGELLWIIPDHVADEAIARLAPPAK